MSEVTREIVDATDPLEVGGARIVSRAVVFGLLPNGKTTTDEFTGPGALDQAHAFKASVVDDFPGGIFAVGADEAAIRDRQIRIGMDYGMTEEEARAWAEGKR